MLVDSFKSTLDEVHELIYYCMVDISHPEFEDHIAQSMLVDIKANDKPVIMVLIKSMLTNILLLMKMIS
jgi:50S ribosomal subunit-associated GTPase HflX